MHHIRAVKHVAERLRKEFADRGLEYPLFVQGERGRTELLDSFRNAGNAVLVGSQSFWEGVDVRGDALSLVIIDKLPFAPPDDPVLAARIDVMEKQGMNGFMHHTLPEAIINLKQGAGRLIRDETDRGVLMICDPRLISKSYGKRVWQSLPPFKRTRLQADVIAFFKPQRATARIGTPMMQLRTWCSRIDGGRAAVRVARVSAGAGVAAEALRRQPPLRAPPSSCRRLAEHYYEEQARFEPINATFSGDNRFDDLLPMTIVPAVRARHFAMLHEVRESLMRIDRSKLAGADLTTFDVLGFEINSALRFEPFKDYLLPMNQMDSVPVVVANFGSGQGSQPIGTVAQYQAYLKRVEALPQWIDAAIANMRVGMKEGIVQPKALMVALLPQIKALAGATPENSDFSAPIRHLPACFRAPTRRA